MPAPGPKEVKPHTRVIAGRDIIFDPEDFIINSDAWTEDVAVVLAREQGMDELGPEHWRVIKFMRDYYQTHGKAPLGRDVRKGVGLGLLEIENMFPGGLKYGVRRLAGIPNPRGCM